MPNQIEKAMKVMIGELDHACLVGKLDDVITFLLALQQKYSHDYQELELGQDGQLFGVRNYSSETQAKLKQLRELLRELPDEAYEQVLRELSEEEEEDDDLTASEEVELEAGSDKSST
jgi:hypothetical protein